MDYNKLHKTVETSNLSITELCKKIKIDRSTFYNNIENKTLKVETLEKICKLLDVPINEFLGEPNQDLKTQLRETAAEKELLKVLKELNACRRENYLLLTKLNKNKKL